MASKAAWCPVPGPRVRGIHAHLLHQRRNLVDSDSLAALVREKSVAVRCGDGVQGETVPTNRRNRGWLY